jgi:hypothetical protein
MQPSPKLARPQNPDDSLLVVLGYDRKFDFALLNVKDRVGDVALHEHVFILFKFKDRLARAHLGEKVLSVKHAFRRIPHLNLLWHKPNSRQAGAQHSLSPK